MEKEIYKKLLNIQQKLKAPKGQFNDFGKYNYRSCEDILEEIKPHLARENTTLFFVDKVENVGNRNYIRTDLHFIDINSGEELVNSAYAREEEVKKGMDGSQITGASSSYARKYALNGLFAIDDTKDSDVTNKGYEPEKIKPSIKKQELDVDGKIIKSIKEEKAEYKQNTLKNAGDFIFPFGKVKGKSIKQVYEEEDGKGYLDWCLDADFVKQDIKDLIAEFLNDVNTGDDPELEEVEINDDELPF